MGSTWMRCQLGAVNLLDRRSRRSLLPPPPQAAQQRKCIIDMFGRRPRIRKRGHNKTADEVARAEVRFEKAVQNYDRRMERFCHLFNGSPFAHKIVHHCGEDCEFQCLSEQDSKDIALECIREEILGVRVPKCSDKEFTSVGQPLFADRICSCPPPELIQFRN